MFALVELSLQILHVEVLCPVDCFPPRRTRIWPARYEPVEIKSARRGMQTRGLWSDARDAMRDHRG